MDAATAVGTYAAVLTFLLLLSRDAIVALGRRLEAEIKRFETNEGAMVRETTVGFYEEVLPRQYFAAACGVGITLCLLWFLWWLMGWPTILIAGRAPAGVLILTLYVLALVGYFAFTLVYGVVHSKADLDDFKEARRR